MIQPNIFSLSTRSWRPIAYAIIQGGDAYRKLQGVANFYDTHWQIGLMVEIELYGLPNTRNNSPRFLGLHIHQNGDCSNNFNNTGQHYNPTQAVHPYHLGDLPSVLNSNGYAFLAFYDSFLSLENVVNRSIIIHDQRDDFTSQPSGDSGNKIACGVISLASSLNGYE